MTKKNYIILILFLQSWIFFSVLLTAPIQSGNAVSQDTSFSVKTSSNVVFERLLDETQVNNYTIGYQLFPSICALSSDMFVVAWVSEMQDPDGSYGVYARVFDATTGNNITREFRVNHYMPSTQEYPSICALSNNTFAVAWESEGQDSGTRGVYARVFNATTGNNITREFRVNYYTPDSQNHPSICALSSDTFAVTWESWGQDSGTKGVYARVFNATTGNNITREFRVNHYTNFDQTFPSICALSNDMFVVAWGSEWQDSGTSGVYARVFDATTGNNITREFRVNYYTPNSQNHPSICALSSDIFAVAWRSWGQDGNFGGVYASVFNATTGNNITREFRVNYYTTLSQNSPSICRLSSDTFAVAWQSEWQDEATSWGVYARVFDATTGNNITREFRVNYNTTDNQNSPSICRLSSDSFAVAWESETQDSGTYGVYVSVFGKPSTSLLSSSAPADDDDDDDGKPEDNLLLIVGITVLVSAIATVSVISVILIKKRLRLKRQN